MNFDDYIQQLLGNVNPQGNMFTGLSSMPPSNNNPAVNNNNPFSIQNAIDSRNAAEAQEAANQRSSALDEMGVENARGLFEAQVIGGRGGGGDYDSGGSSGQGPIGVGKATDAIRAEAFKSFLTGYLTGGLPGAIKGGVQKLASGTADFLGQVNSAVDPLGAWSVLQGHSPVPVVNMDTPYTGDGGGMFTPGSPTFVGPIAPPAPVVAPTPYSNPISDVGGGGSYSSGRDSSNAGAGGSGSVGSGGGRAGGGYSSGGW